MKKLKWIRENQDFTMRDLAEKTGVATSTISEIEQGKRKPRKKTLEKLALALGTTVENLQRRDPIGSPPTPKTEKQIEEEKENALVSAVWDSIQRFPDNVLTRLESKIELELSHRSWKRYNDHIQRLAQEEGMELSESLQLRNEIYERYKAGDDDLPWPTYLERELAKIRESGHA